MNDRTKKIVKFAIRWGIAIGGIWWVVAHMSLRDRVYVLDPRTDLPYQAALARPTEEDATRFPVVDPASGHVQEVERDRIINPATPKKLRAFVAGQEMDGQLLGMRLSGNINRSPNVEQLLFQPNGIEKGTWIAPSSVIGGYRLDVPRPRVEVGLINMIVHARTWLLVLAVVIFPTTFIVTSYRWDMLMRMVEIRMGLARVFVINMVGAFYNTFMPGSTGGDVLKAWYAARQTPYKLRAVMSVVVDRVLGLLALVMIGGVMATYQYLETPSKHDPTARACLEVALASVAIMLGVGVGLAVLFQPALRRVLGLEFILRRLPMQHHVEHAREVARMYRRRPVGVLVALLITIPVHVTVIISALLAGKAFGLPISALYYFTAVPVIVLVGSIPISPQGAGVMEFFAIALTQKQGATVSQAFALTMSIRVVQVFWNLTGGIFVLRGGYHQPTASEQRELAGADDEPAPLAAGAPSETPAASS